jgi:DNA topoisomerase-1
MARNLVIVESPAKARTLAKYLGRNYLVKASVGHIIDLPKSKLGVDIANDFEPDYQVIRGKAKIIEDLKKAAKGKDNIYLAPDPDREGEAIAWHIASKLGRSRGKIRRVLLYEITKQAVQEALTRPQELNQDRFEAQVARRVLDRLVGYQLSPLLWKKVRRGLSAGRVQSVALRIVCERERAIQAFTAEEYWSVTARLAAAAPPVFEARLIEVEGRRLDNKTFRLENQRQVDEVLARLGTPGADGGAAGRNGQGVDWIVTDVDTRERRRNPAPPFITSKLQQEASRKLSFPPGRTMRIAQRLYEGVELGSEGAVGLITYMRTDSTRVSDEAVRAVRGYVAERYGEQYLPPKPNVYRSRKSAQDAHEAIRPTSMANVPDQMAAFLSKEELALYTLIWNRFTASQMAAARFDQTAADIAAGDCRFRATGHTMTFDGFIRVYTEGRDEEVTAEDDDEHDLTLPPLAPGMRLTLQEIVPAQHFTQPPPRFTQATLIKELEENGIGRPSTYATIMSTLLDKEYVVEGDGRRLRPTELGFLITDLLVASFPDVLNVEFTAGMEDVLDHVEEGRENWKAVLRRFHDPFRKDLERAEAEMRDVKREGQPTDIPCEKCGAHMIIRWGRRGEFLACPKYPECRNTKNFRREADRIVVLEAEETDEKCEKCGKPMRVRVGRYGKFLGCSGYPECTSIRPLVRPTSIDFRCPDCHEGDLLERRSRRGKVFYGCSRYPKCRFAVWNRPVDRRCPQCDAAYLVEKTTKRYGTQLRCVREGCGFVESVEERPAGQSAAAAENETEGEGGAEVQP